MTVVQLHSAGSLVRLRCASCDFGISVRREPEECPMCGAAAWKRPGEQPLGGDDDTTPSAA